MAKSNREKVKKNILIVFGVAVFLFYIALHYKIKHFNAEIHNKLVIFDKEPIDDFKSEFSRIRAYINLLADHYGCPDGSMERLESDLRVYNESVRMYCGNRSEGNFVKISDSIEKIVKLEQGYTDLDPLTKMVRSGCHLLTLSIFLISPIKCTNLIPAQSALLQDWMVRKDPLFLYLSTIRQPNIYRGFFNLHKWIEFYDSKNGNNDFKSKFGNVLSYGANDPNNPIVSRLTQFFPELNFSSDRVEEFFANSSFNRNLTSKISAVSSIEKIINTFTINDDSNVIVISNGVPSSIRYSSQISECLSYNGRRSFYLKGMIIKKDDRLALLVFDKPYQIWTMFTEDGQVLSMPRHMAQLYFSHFGKQLIYFAD